MKMHSKYFTNKTPYFFNTVTLDNQDINKYRRAVWKIILTIWPQNLFK